MKLKLNRSLVFKIIIIAISLIALGFFSFWAYRQYREMKKPLLPAINALPENTAFFIEIKKYDDLWARFNEPFSIWERLTEIESFKKLDKSISYLDSLSRADKEIADILKSQTIIIAVTYKENNEFCSLFLVDLAEKSQSSILAEFIKKTFNATYVINDLTKKEVPLFELSSKKNNIKLYYSIYKGVFIAGANKNEVYASAIHLDSKTPIIQKENFSKIYNTAGKNVDANFFLNLAFFQKIMNEFFVPDSYMVSELGSMSNGWVSLDVVMKENIFLLNGFTSNPDTLPGILNLFRNEEPQKIDITTILPDNTDLFLYMGFSDYNNFGQKLAKLNKNMNYVNAIKKINNTYDIELEKYFRYWIGKEIAMFAAQGSADNKDVFNYLAINAQDKKTASEKLNELETKTSPNDKKEKENIVHKGFEINRICIEELLPAFFGFLGTKIKQNYYIIIDNYVVFANSPEALMYLIDKTTTRQTLAENPAYNSFTEYLSDKASLFLFANIPRYLGQLIKTAKPGYSGAIEKNIKIFSQFQSFAMQIIPEKEFFYNTICFDYKSVSINKPSAIKWQLDLDTLIAGKPVVVKNFTQKTNEILITDAANQLYLIDKNGKIIWKKALKESILSNVFQIDYYKNGKLQFLFNTANYIYLVDRNAADVEGYPVKLKSKATNGLLAVYYPDIKDYRIYLACENRKIICLSKEATLVDGWQFKITENIVDKQIQHFVVSNSDYLVFTDCKGRLYVIDRKGAQKVTVDKNILFSCNNVVFCAKDPSGKFPALVSTDRKGEVVYIQLPSGKTSRIIIKDFSADHYFLLIDIGNDKKSEFLFIDNNSLEIYNSSQKLLYSQALENPLSSGPLSLPENDRYFKFGLNDSASSSLLLFSYENGTFNQKEPLPCNSFWTTAFLSDKKLLNILTVSERTLYNYVYE
jgi:hypothetical protein